MLILLWILICGIDMIGVYGPWAQILCLPKSATSAIAIATPIVVSIAYLLGVTLKVSMKWRIMLVGFAILAMFLPVIYFHSLCHGIKTPGGLSGADFTRFKSEFGVPALHTDGSAGPYVTVARRDFRPGMVLRLREMSSKARSKAEPSAVEENPASPTGK